MAKNLTVTVLLDFYGELLTDKQAGVLALYYNEDYSLAEIAAEMGISRQGVRDFIIRGEALLQEYEDKLGLAGRFMKISRLFDELEALVKKESVSQKVLDAIGDIRQSL